MIGEYVKSIGIEVECYITSANFRKWNQWISKHNKNEAAQNMKVTGDTSFSSGCPSGHLTKEITYWATNKKDLDIATKFLFKNCGVRTSVSCGGHVHFKCQLPGSTQGDLDTLSFFSLSRVYKKFTLEFTKYAKANGEKYIRRLTNTTCTPIKYNSKKVAESVEGNSSRYVLMNFASFFDGEIIPRRTIEIRGFPGADSADEQIRNYTWLADTINKIIKQYNKKLVCSYHITNLKSIEKTKEYTIDEIQKEVDALVI
jgi:hypothetical protein